jgi:N utilization substance protein A
VDEDQLSLAIGKRGQNARLTSRLTGWDINIEQDKTAKEVVDSKKESAANAFAAALNVSPEAALKLVNAGMNSVEVIATGSEPQDIADVLGVELEEATAIHQAARQEYEKAMAAKQP